ncbi:general secretion pathway protein GspN [Lysobacter auxotrophicus]|uniref:General secretion pathway protein GspN n=1 Tax=Lysobacter auxotrophicus TaxID=2992573 RepID=A0ABM8DAB5_9GAMM|nr:general secretion pathway protein GspN [Lysobacter auxotrophicus]BDU15510.1 general secretion pathway protein GspN [Lysobacter auxotrophicus]
MRLDDAGPRTWLLATVAGWAVIAWLLAVLGMGRHAQALDADPGLLRPLPNARPPAAQRLGPLSQYAAIAQRPLFSQDRQPKPFFLQGGGEGESQQTAFDYVLTSVLITPTLKMAILQPADGSESVRVKLGEVPESHPAWRLTSLDARSAVFEGPEGRREMTLRVFDGQGGQPPTAVSNAPGANRTQPVGVPVPPAAANAAAANGGRNVPANARPVGNNASPNRNANNNAQTPAPPPAPEPSENTPMTPEAQMEAIRKRIEARRAQMRQQQSAQPPAQTP